MRRIPACAERRPALSAAWSASHDSRPVAAALTWHNYLCLMQLIRLTWELLIGREYMVPQCTFFSSLQEGRCRQYGVELERWCNRGSIDKIYLCLFLSLPKKLFRQQIQTHKLVVVQQAEPLLCFQKYTPWLDLIVLGLGWVDPLRGLRVGISSGAPFNPLFLPLLKFFSTCTQLCDVLNWLNSGNSAEESSVNEAGWPISHQS